jgi:hypothetical protein
MVGIKVDGCLTEVWQQNQQVIASRLVTAPTTDFDGFGGQDWVRAPVGNLLITSSVFLCVAVLLYLQPPSIGRQAHLGCLR